MRLNNAFYDGVPIIEAYYNGERIELSDIVVYGTVEDDLTIGDSVEAKVGQSDSFEIVSLLPISESIYLTKFAGEVVDVEGELDISNAVVPSSLEAGAGEINTPLDIDEEVNPTPAESDIFDPNGKVEIDGEYEAFGVHSDIFDPNGEVSINDSTEAFAPSVILDEAEDTMLFEDSIIPKTTEVILDEAEDSMGFSEEIEGETPRVILACICDTLEIDEEVTAEDPEGGVGEIEDTLALTDRVEGELIPPILTGDFVTFSSDEPFTIQTLNLNKPWDGTLEYSTDAATWAVWDGNVPIGNKTRLYIRGHNNSIITGGATGRWSLTASASVKVQGVIENLLDCATVGGGNIPPANIYCFSHLFYNWDHLEDAGDLIISTFNRDYYCNSLLQNCTALIKAPKIEADVIGKHACDCMLAYASSLTEAPKVTAITIDEYGCANMFLLDKELVKIGAIIATRFEKYAVASMYAGCSKIKLSETRTGEYLNNYKIPLKGSATADVTSTSKTFFNTGGTFTGSPTFGLVYFTSNEIVN